MTFQHGKDFKGYKCHDPTMLWNPVGLQIFVPIGTVSGQWQWIIHTHCPRCRSNFIGNIACGTCEMVLRLDLNDIQLDTLTIIDAVLGNGVFNDFLSIHKVRSGIVMHSLTCYGSFSIFILQRLS